MYQRVVRSPARLAPRMFTADHYRVRLAKFVRSLTPALLGRLDQAAQRFLTDHGLAGTPLYHTHPARHRNLAQDCAGDDGSEKCRCLRQRGGCADNEHSGR